MGSNLRPSQALEQGEYRIHKAQATTEANIIRTYRDKKALVSEMSCSGQACKASANHDNSFGRSVTRPTPISPAIHDFIRAEQQFPKGELDASMGVAPP